MALEGKSMKPFLMVRALLLAGVIALLVVIACKSDPLYNDCISRSHSQGLGVMGDDWLKKHCREFSERYRK